MSLSENFKKVFSASTAKDLMWGVIGAATYLGIPTLTKVNGTPGALLGGGSSLALSILVGQPMAAIGGLVTMAVHATYVYINPKLYSTTGTSIFGWSEDNYSMATPAIGSTSGVPVQSTPGINDVPTTFRLPSGQNVVGYPNNSLNGVKLVGRGKTAQINDKPTARAGAPVVINFPGTNQYRS